MTSPRQPGVFLPKPWMASFRRSMEGLPDRVPEPHGEDYPPTAGVDGRERERGSRRRVLLVDDDFSIRVLFSGALADAGYDVAVASDGHQAQKQWEAMPFDLVITDLVMPNCDGFELLRAARKHDPGLKVIVISGAFEGTFLRTASLLGAVATFEKPVRTEDLLDAVRRVLLTGEPEAPSDSCDRMASEGARKSGPDQEHNREADVTEPNS